MRRVLILLAAVLLGPGAGLAQGRTFALVADQRLAEAGLVGFLVPRFALKHGIRPAVETGDAQEIAVLAQGADALLVTRDMAEAQADTIETRVAVFYADGTPVVPYVLAILEDGENVGNADVFADWLSGEIGQRTVASYQPPADHPPFVPGAVKVAAPAPVLPEGDAVQGEELSVRHCGRCHVVSERNRMGGIGSTPSFAAMRSFDTWQDRFQTFWSENPHPSFTFVEGLTDPIDPDHPPHIAPLVITMDDIEAILAYVASIPPKDLGAPIENR